MENPLDKSARFEYNINVAAREWRNWQTRTFEGRVVYTVRVQVPSLAPISSKQTQGFSLGFVFFVRGDCVHTVSLVSRIPAAIFPNCDRKNTMTVKIRLSSSKTGTRGCDGESARYGNAFPSLTDRVKSFRSRNLSRF